MSVQVPGGAVVPGSGPLIGGAVLAGSGPWPGSAAVVGGAVATGRPESTDEPAKRAGPGRASADWALSSGLVPAASATLAIIDPRLRHWFLIPVTACGILIGVDAFGWIRRRFDIFDPQALLGLLGLHFFYLAPILHVMLDYWPPRILPPADWREALGAMAVLNLVGLAIYRWLVSSGRRAAIAEPSTARFRPALRFNERRFYGVGLLAAAVGLAAFCVEVALFGGVGGFLDVMTQNRIELVGMSWLLIPAESFPLIVFSLIMVRWRTELAHRRGLVLFLLLSLAIVQFLVGGLRGSRSSTVWPVLLGLMLVHFLVFTISRRSLLLCGAIFMIFMYSYGLYKAGGVEVVDIARGTRTAQEISAKTGRDMMPTILLADLGRADIQALVLDRKRQGHGELGYGVTYLGGAELILPRWLLPERLPTKLNVGTEVLYGPGFYDYDARRWSQRVYGLTGEAMLNFGPAGAAVAFIPLGLIVRRSRRLYARAIGPSDLAAKLLAPSLCIATVLVLTSDLDNLVFFLAQRFLPVAAVVLLALSGPPPGQAGHGRRVRTPAGWSGQALPAPLLGPEANPGRPPARTESD
jgi:hypothetical protein